MITIIQGEDRQLTFTLTKSNGSAYSLDGVTAIEARFKKSDESTMSKTMLAGAVSVLSPATYGKLSVTLSDTDTALLKLGSSNPVELIIDVGSARRIFNIDGAITVQAPELA